MSRSELTFSAYTEISLDISWDKQVVSKTGNRTGSMPLHEVRSHLRRLGGGRMVTVRAHKRGDAKNGVRMSHYSVN
jgi:hypothetical protein